MLISIHELRNEDGEQVFEKRELVDEELYIEMKKKKEKLVQQIKAEKVINPKCQEQADKAIEAIKKDKCGYGKVGRVQYFYESLKGLYFYIHKIVEQEGTYTDTIRFYCSQPNVSLYKDCRKADLIK